MNTKENTHFLLASGVMPTQGTWGMRLAEIVRYFFQRTGAFVSTPATAVSVVQQDDIRKMVDTPREIACVSEQEAETLCRSMIASGHAAQVHYDVYDYFWSVQVSAAANGRSD